MEELNFILKDIKKGIEQMFNPFNMNVNKASIIQLYCHL